MKRPEHLTHNGVVIYNVWKDEYDSQEGTLTYWFATRETGRGIGGDDGAFDVRELSTWHGEGTALFRAGQMIGGVVEFNAIDKALTEAIDLGLLKN